MRTPMSFLHWWAQNCTQHFRCSLTTAKQRGRVTSSDLLTMLMQCHPARCWPSLLWQYSAGLWPAWVPGTQDLSLQSCFPARKPLSGLYRCMGLLFRCRALHSLWWTWWCSTLLTSSACQSTVSQLLGVSLFLIWNHLQTCWGRTPSYNLQITQREVKQD